MMVYHYRAENSTTTNKKSKKVMYSTILFFVVPKIERSDEINYVIISFIIIKIIFKNDLQA